MAFARNRAAGAFSLKLVKYGGLLRTLKVATIAEAAGLSLFGGTMLENSIGTAASAQLFSTVSRLDWGCQLFGPELFSDGLTVEQLVFFPRFEIAESSNKSAKNTKPAPYSA